MGQEPIGQMGKRGLGSEQFGQGKQQHNREHLRLDGSYAEGFGTGRGVRGRMVLWGQGTCAQPKLFGRKVPVAQGVLLTQTHCANANIHSSLISSPNYF